LLWSPGCRGRVAVAPCSKVKATICLIVISRLQKQSSHSVISIESNSLP
jgi:hypothetical protein